MSATGQSCGWHPRCVKDLLPCKTYTPLANAATAAARSRRKYIISFTDSSTKRDSSAWQRRVLSMCTQRVAPRSLCTRTCQLWPCGQARSPKDAPILYWAAAPMADLLRPADLNSGSSPCSSSAEGCFCLSRCSSARLKGGQTIDREPAALAGAKLRHCNTWAQPEMAKDLLGCCLVFPCDGHLEPCLSCMALAQLAFAHPAPALCMNHM